MLSIFGTARDPQVLAGLWLRRRFGLEAPTPKFLQGVGYKGSRVLGGLPPFVASTNVLLSKSVKVVQMYYSTNVLVNN